MSGVGKTTREVMSDDEADVMFDDGFDDLAVKALSDRLALLVTIRCKGAGGSCGRRLGIVWETTHGAVLVTTGKIHDDQNKRTVFNTFRFLRNAEKKVLLHCYETKHGFFWMDTPDLRGQVNEAVIEGRELTLLVSPPEKSRE